MRFAFLSDGKLFVKSGNATPRLLESAFAAERVAREQERSERHAWKGAGRDPQDTFNARAVWGRQAAREKPEDIAPVFRHLCAGAAPGELLYVLEMSASSGLFRQNVETGEEQRIFHRREFFCGGLACTPGGGDIVFSAAARGGLANLERLGADRAGDQELTDGEARDTHPAHVPGQPGVLVFQSSGAGRDGEGHLLAFGPAAIMKFVPGAHELETLVEHDACDHLAPRQDREGNLYFIRRPYRDFARIGLFGHVKNIVFMPYYLGSAVFGFLDAFTRIFGRASLRHAGGPETEPAPARRWIHIHETSVELGRALKRHAKGDDSASLVPASWELIRLSPDGVEELIANKVACYTLGDDDTLLYSNGFTVWRRAPGASTAEVVHRGKIIQSLAILR